MYVYEYLCTCNYLMIQKMMMLMIAINATTMKTPITAPIIVMEKLEATEKNREREKESERRKKKKIKLKV